MPRLKILLLILGSMAIFSASAWAAGDDVSRALDAYEDGRHVAREQMSIPPKTVRDTPQNSQQVFRIDQPFPDPAGRRVHETEVGFEGYSYKYKETVEGDHFMDLQGRFYGVFLNHTFRPAQMDPFFSGLANMFRMEVRYARARLNYNGGVQFSDGSSVPLLMHGIPDWVAEARGIVGKDFAFFGMMVTPFSGLGIRALQDDAAKVTGTFDNGGVPDTINGYKRVSHYYYVPVGVEVERSFPDQWRARLSMEYDFLLSGMQRSYSAVDILYQGVDYHYNSIDNRQTKGYGLRASLNLKKEVGPLEFFAEPFCRFWNIEDSALAHLAAGGGYEFVGIAMEPSNTTREIGLKMGVVF